MGEYIGLDVSLKETAVSIRRDGKRVWRGKCASDPQALAALIRKHAPEVERVVFETGLLSIWFYHALSAEGLPAICIDARHAKAALDMAPNKTDANDADGLAHLAEVGPEKLTNLAGLMGNYLSTAMMLTVFGIKTPADAEASIKLPLESKILNPTSFSPIR